jgi:hypothetical protein
MNSSTPRLYRRVATRFQEGGWTKRMFRSQSGKCCLVQALLDELGLHQFLPADVLVDLSAELGQRQDFRSICARFMPYGADTQELIMKWNDAPFRRSADVVQMLDALADRLEAEQRRVRDELDQYLDDAARQPVLIG